MNYYPHHIGDFDRATRHLTRTERSIYRDLLDVYYDTEKPLTLDLKALCHKIIARSAKESATVKMILAEFFVETPTGWYHDRCEEEIEAYRNNNTQKSMAGKASAEKRAERRRQALSQIEAAVERSSNEVSTAVQQPFNGSSTASQLTSNQEPATSNQEPTNDNTVVVGNPQPATEPLEPATAPRAAPMPAREQPPVSDDPAVAISVALRRQGVPANSTHPAVREWAAKGVSPALLTEAIAIAREVKGTETIPPNYLAPIVAKLLNPQQASFRPSVRAPVINEKFNFSHLDRSGDARAMAASMARHGITVPTDDEEIEI